MTAAQEDGNPHPEIWSLTSSNIYRLNASLCASIDVRRPDCGLELLHRRHPTFRARALQLSRGPNREKNWPLQLSECYVRGRDLVVSYLPVDAWPYAPQLYWTAGPLDDVPGVQGSLSLLVSIQTHLLDSRPVLNTETMTFTPNTCLFHRENADAPGCERLTGSTSRALPEGVTCVLNRFTDSKVSYVEIMQSGDATRVAIEQADNSLSVTSWELFAEFLEKGVIRRARIFAALIDRHSDLEVSVACCDRIAGASLPLTT